MNELLRENISVLLKIRNDFRIEEVYLFDQILSNGRSTGACFKLIFHTNKHKNKIKIKTKSTTTSTVIYVFPERRWCAETGECPADIAEVMNNWIKSPFNDPV
jgi:hypothetical protein